MEMDLRGRGQEDVACTWKNGGSGSCGRDVLNEGRMIF